MCFAGVSLGFSSDPYVIPEERGVSGSPKTPTTDTDTDLSIWEDVRRLKKKKSQNRWQETTHGVRAEGPWPGTLRKSEVKSAVTVSAFSLDACWGGKNRVIEPTLPYEEPAWCFCPEKDLWSNFCSLSIVVFSRSKNKSWISVLSFLLPHSCFSRFLMGRQPLALGLFFTSASPPALIEAKVALFCSPKCQSSSGSCAPEQYEWSRTKDTDVFLPPVCVSLFLWGSSL